MTSSAANSLREWVRLDRVGSDLAVECIGRLREGVEDVPSWPFKFVERSRPFVVNPLP